MAFRQVDLVDAETVQTAAAQAPQLQARLVAGPGSGKSATIEKRVCWLLGQGIAPSSIAVVSFTNASVIDLRNRLQSYCTSHGQVGIVDVSISTLHSLALRLLRQAGLLESYSPRPLVLDDWELENIYDAEFGEAQGVASKRRKEIRRYYEALWSTGLEGATTYVPPVPAVSPEERECFLAFHDPTALVYSCVLPGELVRKCVDAVGSGLLDIAQLLGVTDLVVDEYQDLNPADLELVDVLAAAGVRVFVAGDDDQSVYSFRHASPNGIQQFGAKYPESASHILQHCFRCTPAVLHAATALITSNAAPGRIQKTQASLYETADPANPGAVYRWKFARAKQEAQAIAESCQALIAAGIRPRDILILLSTSQAAGGLWSVIRTELEASAVAFDPPKEEGFGDSQAGRFVLSIARIVCSRDSNGTSQDLLAHRTLLGLTKGVGVTTCNSIREAVLQTPNLNFRGLFYEPLPGGVFSARATKALVHARETCATISSWKPTDTLAERGEQIETAIRAAISDEAAETWAVVCSGLPQEMTLTEVRDYIWVDDAQKRAEVLDAVASRLGVATETIVQAEDRVRVMTMHGAKGLSAKVVFVPGLEHGLLPNRHQSPYPAQLFEAARMLYVSITRARAACILSFASRRTIFGTSETRYPSQFAAQTGGSFQQRTAGLAEGEVAEVLGATSSL